jgi:hypothetical protein
MNKPTTATTILPHHIQTALEEAVETKIPHTNEIEVHPYCAKWPKPPPERFKWLVDDIRRIGQRDAGILDENGVLLDGKTRWDACKEIGSLWSC